MTIITLHAVLHIDHGLSVGTVKQPYLPFNGPLPLFSAVEGFLATRKLGHAPESGKGDQLNTMCLSLLSLLAGDTKQLPS